MPSTHPDFIFNRLNKTYVTFLVLSKIEVSEDLLKDARKKWINWPLTLTLEIIYYTNHACVVSNKIVDTASGRVLVNGTNKFVYCDPATRQPTPLPEWVLEIGSAANDPAQKVPMTYQKPAAIPDGAFHYPYRMMYSDHDFNHHVNNVVYTRLFMDAASVAVTRNLLRTFQHSIYHYDTRMAVSYFAKECRAGDEVDIIVWQHKDNDLMLHCAVQQKEHFVYFGDIEFYPRVDAKIYLNSKY